jgi:hypothetical protein
VRISVCVGVWKYNRQLPVPADTYFLGRQIHEDGSDLRGPRIGQRAPTTFHRQYGNSANLDCMVGLTSKKILRGGDESRRTRVSDLHGEWLSRNEPYAHTSRRGNLASTVTNSESGFYRGGIRDITAPKQENYVNSSARSVF